MPKIRLTIPASTTNLGCGFDCLGIALTLYNVVEVEFTEKPGLFIKVEGEGEELIPANENNIIFPAIKMVFERAGKKLTGIKIREINSIPLQRGLGSSAATRLGGIIAASYLLNINLSERDILKMATFLEGHPDNVAASFLGGFVAVTRTSDDNGMPLWIKLDVPDSLRLALVIPQIEVSTEKARRILPSKVSLSDAVFNLSRLALLIPSLTKGIWDNFPLVTQDRIHQPYRSSLIPGMYDVFKAALDAGAKGAFLSGAGSSIAAFVLEREAKKVGEAMQKEFFKRGIKSTVRILSVDKKGVQIDEKNK